MNGSARIQVPRRIQLTGLPLALLLAWTLLGAVRHVAFLFVAALAGTAAALGPSVADEARTADERAYVTEVDGQTRAADAHPEPPAAGRP